MGQDGAYPNEKQCTINQCIHFNNIINIDKQPNQLNLINRHVFASLPPHPKTGGGTEQNRKALVHQWMNSRPSIDEKVRQHQ